MLLPIGHTWTETILGRRCSSDDDDDGQAEGERAPLLAEQQQPRMQPEMRVGGTTAMNTTSAGMGAMAPVAASAS